MSVAKTKSLKRQFLPINSLVPNSNNPNEMSDKEFNMLYDNIESVGLTDPVLVRPIEGGLYRIIGGHHRWEVAKVVGYTEVPVTIIDDPNFTEDEEKFQLVRHNVIHGKMSANKFMDLYSTLSHKYEEEILQEFFGFTDEDEFKKLINKTAKSLPKEMQEEFKEAAKDIKNIDGLSKLLNRMFSQHGDSLPYGYMVVDFGGQDSIWLRMRKADFKNFLELASMCRKEGKAVDHLFSSLVQSIAQGSIGIENLLKSLPTIQVAEASSSEGIPTLDFLEM